RMPKNIILGSTMVMMAVSVFILSTATSLPMAMAYAVLYGIAWGMRTPVMNAIQGDYFGRKSQGIIRGWLNSITLPLRVSAPLLVAFVADLQGTYRHIFMISSFVTLVGSALIFLATPPKPPVQDEAKPE
ncbi:MFS transporter, partial [Chloroflexota bacterium]